MAKNYIIACTLQGPTVRSTTVAQLIMYIMATTVISSANRRSTIGPGLDDMETSSVKWMTRAPVSIKSGFTDA